MIKGTKLEINDTEYIFPPITIGVIELMEDDLSNLQNLPFKKQVSLAVDLAHASLKRNYPGITREFVANELLDVSNMWDIVTAITSASQLTNKVDDGTEAKK